MREYPKIQTVFKRDPTTNMKTLLDGDWSLPEFGYLANNEVRVKPLNRRLNMCRLPAGGSPGAGSHTPGLRRRLVDIVGPREDRPGWSPPSRTVDSQGIG